MTVQFVRAMEDALLDIGSERWITFSPSDGRLVLLTPAERREIVPPLFERDEAPGFTVWSDPRSDCLLLHDEMPFEILVIDLTAGTVNRVPLPDRQPDICGRAEFVETKHGPMMVFERGVIAFDTSGTVRWQQLGLAPEDFGCVRDDAIEYVGYDGGRWTFDSLTGARRPLDER